MNSKKNISLLVVGVVMAAVTLLGVFALITDTADTGTFSFESQDEASSIDLKIRNLEETGSSTDCDLVGSYVDNASVSFMTESNKAPAGAFREPVHLHPQRRRAGGLHRPRAVRHHQHRDRVHG